MLLAWILIVVASFADIIGGSFTVIRRLTESQMLTISGLGAGFLLGATILDRLPDAMSQLPSLAPVLIVTGYLTLLLIGALGAGVHRHQAQDEHGQAHELSVQPLMNSRTALISFLGLLLHTFMDGVIIAGAFSIGRGTGVLMFLAITMHKVPEGFSMSTISLAAGQTRRTAFLTSVGLAVSTMVGAGFTLALNTADIHFVKVLMAFAAGSFLYVSATDLIPAVKTGKFRAIAAVVVGVVFFYLSLLFVKSVGLG